MYLNPVGSSEDDHLFAEMARTYKNPGSSVDVVSLNPLSAPPLMNNLEYRSYEALIFADTVKAARQAAKEGFDAMVIGCFYDPALMEAREVSGSTIIVGPCQASIMQVLLVANKFSIIIGQTRWSQQMRETIYRYGYGDHLASFESLELRVDEFHGNPPNTIAAIRSAALRAYHDHNAEAIILGCTMGIGFHRNLQDYLSEQSQGKNIPVIDCSIVALKVAESAALQVQIGLSNSRVWSMEAPQENELSRFDIYQEDYVFGNRVHIPANS